MLPASRKAQYTHFEDDKLRRCQGVKLSEHAALSAEECEEHAAFFTLPVYIMQERENIVHRTGGHPLRLT